MDDSIPPRMKNYNKVIKIEIEITKKPFVLKQVIDYESCQLCKSTLTC